MISELLQTSFILLSFSGQRLAQGWNDGMYNFCYYDPQYSNLNIRSERTCYIRLKTTANQSYHENIIQYKRFSSDSGD